MATTAKDPFGLGKTILPSSPDTPVSVSNSAVTQSANAVSSDYYTGSVGSGQRAMSAINEESASTGGLSGMNSRYGAVSNTSLHPGSTGGLRSRYQTNIKSNAMVSQPIAGQLTPNKNDHASVDVSSAFLSGKVSTEVAPEPDEGEEEMNTFRENPQNDGGSKAKQVFKLHRAQTLLVKPQLFGSLVGTTPFKVKMYERTSRQVGRRLPVDNCRLNTFDFKLPQSKLA